MEEVNGNARIGFITNIGHDCLTANVSTLSEFAPGAAFSTVYDPMTRQFLAQPSGDSRLVGGAVPANLVPRRGGHAIVNQQFSKLTGTALSSHVGLTMFLEEDGTLAMEWRSATVNGVNSSFAGDLVPEALRPLIIEDVGNATGRTVRSR